MVNYLVAREKPVGLVVNFGERKVEIKRKVRDFDEDLQDDFDVLILNILLILSKKSL
jgi:hypothetical protein